MVPGRSARGEAGFTLLELMVVFFIGIFLVFMVLPGIQRFTHRANMEMIARETTSLMLLARREAVKTNLRTNVAFDFTAGQIYAYVDADGSNIEEAGEREIGRITLPQKVYFWDAHDVAAKGANAIVSFNTNTCFNVPKPPPTPPLAPTVIACDADGVASFQSDGSVVKVKADSSVDLTTGAVHFGDEYRNYLEVSIAIAGNGKIELRKWNPTTSKYDLRDASTPWTWYP